MKKIISIIISVFMCFSFSSCGEIVDWALSGDSRFIGKLDSEYKTDIPLSGDLFDEDVMKAVELEWLQKPENVQNEWYESGEYYAKYCGYFSSIEDGKAYLTYVFEGLIEHKNTLGTFNKSLWYGAAPYSTVVLSKHFSDFYLETDSSYIFSAYFTTAKKTWIKTLNRYLLTNAKIIRILIKHKANEDGLYEFYVFVDTYESPSFIREPFE